MKHVSELDIEGLKLIEPEVHSDRRGFFIERFDEKSYRDAGLPIRYVQDNHSRSQPGVLRGLHYQADPPQGKLVGVIRGRIWDVSVDLRPRSSTFGRNFCIELNDENGYMLWVPAGFAHGFCVLGDGPADVLYKADQLYNPSSEGGIVWSDADLAVKWPLSRPMLSPRDENLQTFAKFRENPPATFAQL